MSIFIPSYVNSNLHMPTLYTGWIQDFKLGGALKTIAPSGGRRENVRVFRVKNHDFTKKNHIFSNFRGGARRVRPPLDPPLIYTLSIRLYKYWHEQVILWKSRWNNIRILLKITYINSKLKKGVVIPCHERLCI